MIIWSLPKPKWARDVLTKILFHQSFNNRLPLVGALRVCTQNFVAKVARQKWKIRFFNANWWRIEFGHNKSAKVDRFEYFYHMLCVFGQVVILRASLHKLASDAALLFSVLMNRFTISFRYIYTTSIIYYHTMKFHFFPSVMKLSSLWESSCPLPFLS